MHEYCTTPKDCMALAYERACEEEMDDVGLNAAYAEILGSVHKEMEEFVRKYCPKRLNDLDDLMEQAFWQYH
jgi:hypothetical protein